MTKKENIGAGEVLGDSEALVFVAGLAVRDHPDRQP
jgi:hypothetical protein